MDRKWISVLHKSHGFQAWIKKSASIFGNFFIINNETKNYVTKQSRVYWSQDILWSRGFWPLCVEEEGTVRMEYDCSFGESAVINITPGELLICLEMVLYWPMLLLLGHPAVVKVRLLIVCTISIPVTKRTLYIEDYQELRREIHGFCETYCFVSISYKG